MSRLVYAEDVKREIDKWLDVVGDATIGKGMSYYGELLGCIEDAPTIEAKEVAHGEWIDEGDYLATAYGKLDARTCSACKCVITIDDYDNYCPACGARMDGAECVKK